MKPVDFDYERPRSVAAVTELLASRADAKILAGGQTLGPMLNLRLVQPGLLIDVTRIPELVEVSDEGDGVAIGACVTHAAFEDDRFADPTNGYLRRVASGIAYRAVRTRGTVGGSLAHADPAADWLSALLALDADLEIAASERRRVALSNFVTGVMETDLQPAELLTRIYVRKTGADMRHGYCKICRKTGEFADAIGAMSFSPGTGRFRMVAAGGSEALVIFDDPKQLFKNGDPRDPDSFDVDMVMDALGAVGMQQDAYEMRLRATAMARAAKDALRS